MFSIMAKYLLYLILILIASPALPQSIKTFIPPAALTLKPTVIHQQELYFPTIPIKAYPFALIEQESCIHLKHSKCWNPRSQLKTSREEGAGLGQLTRAYKPDGTLRFDSLQGIRNQYKQDLEDLSWSNIYQRPDLQIRAMTLMLRDTYKGLYDVKDPIARLHFTDAAYNGGTRDLRKERVACGLKINCNPQIWFDHVEHMRVKSTKPLYGTRSAYFINREHVENVFKLRLPKYEKMLATSNPDRK